MDFAELISHGRFTQPDPITGGATAIGPIDDGFAAASGHARVAALGSDFPQAVRRRDAATHAAIAFCRGSVESLNPGVESADISARWLANLIAPVDPKHENHWGKWHAIRQFISVIEASSLDQYLADHLQQLAGGAEFDVYFSPERRCVYKLTRVHPFIPGVLRGGWLPGAMVFAGDSASIEKGEPTTILDLFDRIALGNRLGCFVFTEIAAVLTDGRVLLKQPLIDPGRASSKEERRSGLSMLGFDCLDREEVLLASIEEADGSVWCVGDLHEKNVLIDDALVDNGRSGAFIIDYNARRLTTAECAQLPGRSSTCGQ